MASLRLWPAAPLGFAVLACAALFAVLPAASGLRFELHSGQTKCVSDEIKAGAMAVGKYSVINPAGDSGTPIPENHRISLRVTSPHGNNMHFAENVEGGNFAFTAAEQGDYLACFWAPDHKPSVSFNFEFEWRSGVAARDWGSVAKKGQVDMMELELKKLEDTVRAIHEEMYYLREREEEMQDMNRKTNSRMAWLSLVSLGVALSVAGLQLWHLKTFFERKKLL